MTAHPRSITLVSVCKASVQNRVVVNVSSPGGGGGGWGQNWKRGGGGGKFSFWSLNWFESGLFFSCLHLNRCVRPPLAGETAPGFSSQSLFSANRLSAAASSSEGGWGGGRRSFSCRRRGCVWFGTWDRSGRRETSLRLNWYSSTMTHGHWFVFFFENEPGNLFYAFPNVNRSRVQRQSSNLCLLLTSHVCIRAGWISFHCCLRLPKLLSTYSIYYPITHYHKNRYYQHKYQRSVSEHLRRWLSLQSRTLLWKQGQACPHLPLACVPANLIKSGQL